MKIAQHEILTIMQSWNSATLKATMLKSLTSLVYKEDYSNYVLLLLLFYNCSRKCATFCNINFKLRYKI